MKKIIIILSFTLFIFIIASSQENTPIKLSISSGGRTNKIGDNKKIIMQYQVGWTQHSVGTINSGSNSTVVSAHYPWDILYQKHTFNEKDFFISKGFFSDKITLRWNVRSNIYQITGFNIYRKQANAESEFSLIKRCGADVSDWDDNNVLPGVLYEYRLKAIGIYSEEKYYINIIEGIGYRNPTATITGKIAFKGGTPVSGVNVYAESGNNATGKSLKFNGTATSVTLDINTDIVNELTWEAWINPTEASGAIYKNQNTVFELTSNTDSKYVDITLGSTKLVTIPKSEFSHISAVFTPTKLSLYLNGDSIAQFTPSSSFNLAATSLISMGNKFTGYIDEVRVWRRVLSKKEIKSSYSRFLGGNEIGLISYVRCNEGYGMHAYDISHKGIDYNQNHLILNGWVEWSDISPLRSQLTIRGITDKSGNYIISGISYNGEGQLFKITPVYEKHKFEPTEQLLYIGKGATVHNGINYTDVSSFIFKGRVLYSIKGLFPGDNSQTSSVVLDRQKDGYNTYYSTNNKPYTRGEYELKTDKTISAYKPIAVKGANVKIDGKLVLDDGNMPVTTNSEGNFEISVPIGEHYITVEKRNHTFTHLGQFPAATEENKYEKYDFREDATGHVTFIDTTKVTLVGRVVGGAIEKNKQLGFGITPEHEEFESSKNNIGQAKITLNYSNSHTLEITTNKKSGEYRIDLIPEDFTITNVSIEKDFGSTINFEELSGGSLPVVLSNFNKKTVVTDTLFDINGEIQQIDSVCYNHSQSFIYRAPATLSVTYPLGWGEKNIQNSTFTKDETPKTYIYDSKMHPIFMTGSRYRIDFEAYEAYKNFDIDGSDIYTIPTSDGEIVINNNLDIKGKEVTIELDKFGKARYNFRAGIPSLNKIEEFKKAIDIQFKVDKNPKTNIVGFDDDKKSGIILGVRPMELKDFVTGPQLPKIILRDPPGSNSYSYISKGSSFSTTTSTTSNFNRQNGMDMTIATGVDLKFGGGLAGPVFSAETDNDNTIGINIETSSSDGNSVTETYTLTESWKTSDDANYVGSDGDLFVGDSKNYQLGVSKTLGILALNQVEAYNQDPNNTQKIEYIGVGSYMNQDSVVEDLAIAVRKSIFMNEGERTMFMYSQAHIKNVLIPKYELLANTPANPESEHKESPQWYEQQATLWHRILADNEALKIKASEDRLKKEILASIRNLTAIVVSERSLFVDDKSSEELKKIADEKIKKWEGKEEFVKANVFNNYSFDAGLGEYSQEITTEKITESSYDWNVVLSEKFSTEIGVDINGFGFKISSENSLSQGFNNSQSEEVKETVTVGYVLKDSDSGDYYSVDVYNPFDGNGPIFITQGGQSKCPHEGTEYAQFNEKNERVVINNGTLQREMPEIVTADAKNNISGVPSNGDASFNLKLINNSESEEDMWYQLKVDEKSNPDGAVLKIDGSGINRMILVRYNQPVYKTLTIEKGANEIYDYKNIGIILHSPCSYQGSTSDIADSLYVSVSFQPSCSEISVISPINNWTVNRTFDNKLNITLAEYDRNLGNFKRIQLLYKSSAASEWNNLRYYYINKSDYESSEIDESIKELVTDEKIIYNWKLNNIKDGQYDIKAISYCSDGSEFESNISSGIIDRERPVAFGSPQPADGILSSDDDIMIKFNEKINKEFIDFTNIKLSGMINQPELTHNTSLYFDTNSQMNIRKPIINRGSLTFEFWLKPTTSQESTIIYQGGKTNPIMTIGLTLDNRIEWKIDNKTITSEVIENFDTFNHYSLVYDDNTNRVNINVSGISVLEKEEQIDYKSDQNIIIGGDFKGNVYDFRIWGKALSFSECSSLSKTKLTGTEKSLIGYWPMDEADGDIAFDLAQNNHASQMAQWDVLPKGKSFAFNGSQGLELDISKTVISSEMNMTIEFWFKSSQLSEATLIANGKGLKSEYEGENRWNIFTKGDSHMYVQNYGSTFKATNIECFDGKWHHFAIVLNRLGNLTSYLDGKKQNTITNKNFNGFIGSKAYVGVNYWKTDVGEIFNKDSWFNGFVDEIRVWNLARTEKQIKRDYTFKLSGKESGLLSYYPFEYRTVEGGLNTYTTLENSARDFEGNKNGQNAIPISTESFSGDDVPKIKSERPVQDIDVSWIVNDDEIYITPNIQNLSIIEKQILDITVSNIMDVYGNTMASPVTWTAYVDRNQLKWSDQEISIDKKLYGKYSFNVRIVNRGGTQQNYEIEDIPKWLSVQNSSGEIAPNSYLDLEFSVKEYANIGRYNHILYLKSDFGFGEKFTINMDITTTPPDWKCESQNYQYSSNLIGKISINSSESSNEDNMVAAFIDGECRGVANLRYIESIDAHLLFLDIYSNELNKKINFVVWNASEGSIMEDVTPELTFEDNKVYGSIGSPINLVVSNNYLQEIDLSKGWNWFSTNLKGSKLNNLTELLADIKESDNNQIKNQSQYLQYSTDAGWNGSLSEINNNSMYMIKIDEDVILKINGNRVQVSSSTIPITEKWNWISYLPKINLPINNALSGYTASEGELIKGQQGFATYINNIGWVGSLDYLKSGKGYMLYANNEGALTYNESSSLKSSSSENDLNIESPWELNNNKYPTNMSIIAIVNSVMDDDVYLASFKDGECIGITSKTIVNDNNYYFFLTVQNNEVDDVVTFKLYNKTIDKELPIEESVQYLANDIRGSINSPFELNIDDKIVSTNIFSDNNSVETIIIKPNPFEEYIEIEYINKRSQKNIIEIYDLFGNKIHVLLDEIKESGHYVERWDGTSNGSIVSSGYYIVKITMGDKVTSLKIVKL